MAWLLWMLQLSSVTVLLAVLMKTPPPFCQTTNHVSKSEHPIGAMDEVGKGQKANTHVSNVGVDLARLEGDDGA